MVRLILAGTPMITDSLGKLPPPLLASKASGYLSSCSVNTVSADPAKRHEEQCSLQNAAHPGFLAPRPGFVAQLFLVCTHKPPQHP